MRQDAWRGYLQLALGLTESSRKQATKAVKRVIGKGGATAEQLQGLADEVLKTSAANREAVTALVRTELDRALSRVGLAKADEVAELTARVRELEAELRAARAGGAAAPVEVAPVPAAEPFGAGSAEPVAPVKVVKKTAKKAVRGANGPAEPGDALTASLDAAASGQTKTAPTKRTPAKTVPAKSAPVKAEPAKSAPVKKVAAKKVARKAAGGARP